MSGLLATKLLRPSIFNKQVHRPQLIQRLNEGLESGRQIILVSAPAGFGKTTCISKWVSELDMPVAWLTLDPADDDPGRFFTYLIAALQKVNENLGQEIEGVLRAGQLPSAEIISTTISNDIQDLEERFLLVLDDFQVIQDRFILQILEDLVYNLPPPLYLVLLTREDPSLPLARLRANHQLTEIRARDLRFTETEADYFLKHVMGLSISQEDISALQARTEGWVVGLYLAGLSIRDRADPSTFIASLSGSHRFILSYLTEEVLSQQPEEIQEFLLQTSILDRMNGDLCNAVTGRIDSHALLEQIYSANLFLIPLDDEGQWYRYHQLFTDLLCERQDMLKKRDTAERHQRASRWYAGAGMVSEAIQHALAAEDYPMVVYMIESHAIDMLMQWHVKTVEGWMQAIPPEWISQSPQANLAFAWMQLMRGNPEKVTPFLSRLKEMFSDSQTGKDDPSLEAKWLALQSLALNAQEKPEESLALGKRALEIAPHEEGQVRSMIYLGLADAYRQMDDYNHAAEAFQNLIQLGQASGNSVTELLGSSALALLAIQHGQLHFAFEIASQGIARMERSGSLPPVSQAMYGELAVIHYQWHHLEQAHHYFQRAIQVSALSGLSDAALFYGVILSRLFHIQGDLEAAAREVQKAVDLMKVEAPTVVLEDVISQQVRIYLAQDNPGEADNVIKIRGERFKNYFSFPDIEGQITSLTASTLYISKLRILLYRSKEKNNRADLKSGIKLAKYLIDEALKLQYIPIALEVLLVRARLYTALGDDQACQADYIRALELGEPDGFISIFVEEGSPVSGALKSLLEQNLLGTVQPDYARQILAAFPSPGLSMTTPCPKSAEFEPLTDRELDVLRLMAEGMKYEEIAKRLYISLNTVRSHIKAIYGKFGVDNRTKAIDQARQMRVL